MDDPSDNPITTNAERGAELFALVIVVLVVSLLWKIGLV